MLTGETRNGIDGIWTILWTEGSTNPLTNIEQITYLLFMKNLDEIELAKEEDGELLGIKVESIFPTDKQHYRWSKFKNLPAQDMYRLVSEEIFPFIQNLQGDEGDTAFSRYMKDARFLIKSIKSKNESLVCCLEQ